MEDRGGGAIYSQSINTVLIRVLVTFWMATCFILTLCTLNKCHVKRLSHHRAYIINTADVYTRKSYFLLLICNDWGGGGVVKASCLLLTYSLSSIP